jgi:hypothetical protein
MAHPFDAVCCPYDPSILINMISDDTFKRLFDRTAEKNIAFEINVAYTKNMTPEEIANDCHIRMFCLAKECGCKFTFGSDSHSISYPELFLERAAFVAELLDLKESDLAKIAR